MCVYHNVVIECIPLLDSLVEGNPAKITRHGCLCKQDDSLGNSIHRIPLNQIKGSQQAKEGIFFEGSLTPIILSLVWHGYINAMPHAPHLSILSP